MWLGAHRVGQVQLDFDGMNANPTLNPCADKSSRILFDHSYGIRHTNLQKEGLVEGRTCQMLEL